MRSLHKSAPLKLIHVFLNAPFLNPFRQSKNKVFQDTDMPTRISIENFDLCTYLILRKFNEVIDKCKFPEIMERVNATPVYKKDSRNDEINYSSVSRCLNYLKIMKNACLVKRIDNILPKY